MTNFPPHAPSHTAQTYEARFNKKSKRKLWLSLGLGCGTLIVVPIVALVIFLYVIGTSGTMEVQPWSALSSNQQSEITSTGLLDANETPILVFSNHLFDYEADTCFFTGQRVATYKYNDHPDTYESALYKEIADIELYPSDTFIDDSVVVVTKHDGTEILLIVTNLKGDDRRFYNRLVTEWEAHTSE